MEDHFARINTALTRGKPVVKVGVIHPVESYWLHWGPAEQTALVRDNMDQNFQNMTSWLLFGGIDFDFISESLLPDMCKEGSAPLQVGEMAYDVILVPGCETLRSTTLERLEAFAAAGGKLIFTGQLPTLENARTSSRGTRLAEKALCIPFNQGALLDAMEGVRLVEIRNQTGALTQNLLHQLRQDGDCRWLFIAHGTEPYNKDVSRFQDLRIRLAGTWKATIYNTMTGNTEDIPQTLKGNATEVYCRMYDYDSLLLKLEPVCEEEYASAEYGHNQTTQSSQAAEDFRSASQTRILDLPERVPYTLSEPNVLLLDQAEYALDDGKWQPKEEILRLDNVCRSILGWPSRKESFAQPWVVAEEPLTHNVHLRWHIQSDIDCDGIQLAIEDAERVQITWNGQKVDNALTGWYVDKSIKTVALPPLQTGENILEATIPFGRRTNIEWAYLLGDFGVEVYGRSVRIIPARKEIAFGNITGQGLPFYGGNITYHVPVTTKGGTLSIRSSHYRGAMQSVSIDAGSKTAIIYPPYTAVIGMPEAGKHTVDITLYGHRRNSFGPVHLTDLEERWIGPGAWRSENEKWCYDYKICEEGILTTPVITENLK